MTIKYKTDRQARFTLSYSGERLRTALRFSPGIFAILMLAGIAACSSPQTEDVAASGTIETTDVNVSPMVAGTITRLRASDGDVVRTGDTIAIIDDGDLRLQREQLLAGLDMTRAQYELLENGPRSEDIGQAVEAEKQAKANLDNASDDVRRLRELLHVGAVPEKQVSDAETRREVAQRGYESAKLAVQRLRSGSRPEDLRAAQARQAQAQAQIAALDKRIRDCIVTAPVAGIVTATPLEQGEFAPLGSAIATIARTESVELSIYVPESDLGRVRLGQDAEVRVDAFPNNVFNGRVTYISPNAEFTPKNIQTKDDRVKQVFEVRITVPNESGDLKAGLTADARLLSRRVANK